MAERSGRAAIVRHPLARDIRLGNERNKAACVSERPAAALLMKMTLVKPE